MRRIATSVIAFLLLSATNARAQIDLYSTNGCGYGGNSWSNACISNTGTALAVYGSMVMPAITRNGFVGAVSTLDVQSISTTLPDWWRADACRSGSFAASADPAVLDTDGCGTLWDGGPVPVTLFGVVFPFWAGTDHIRFVITSTLPEADARDLVGDGATWLLVFKLTIDKARSTGAGSCDGCVTGACLTLRDIALHTLSDTPETVVHLSAPHLNNAISYQSGVPWCFPTPTRNHTWGAIKSLYR